MPQFQNRVKGAVSNTDQAVLGLYMDVKEVLEDTPAFVGDILMVDSSGSDTTITLPEPSGNMLVPIKKIDSTDNVVTVETPGSQQIDGVSEITISNEFVSQTITSVNGKHSLI
jgi:hypothetical protein